MSNRNVRLKNRNGDYLYPYTENIPTDTTPTSGSVKLVTSGGVYTALQGKLNSTDTATKATADASGNNIVSTYATKTELTTLQNSVANNTAVMHNSGNETIDGTKTFKSAVYSAASSNNGTVVTTVGKSKSSNGYFKLGNGLILQWGETGASDGGTNTITYPTAFTNTNYKIVAGMNRSSAGHTDYYAPNIHSRTTTNCSVSNRCHDGWGAGVTSWIAIGY